MKRNILLIAGIFFTTLAWCQLEPAMKDLKGNIVLVGVTHDGVLYKETPKGLEKAALMTDSSRKMFCTAYPEILKASQGKSIIFLLEALKPNLGAVLSPSIVAGFKLPNCLATYDTLLGCDTRPDIIKVQSVMVMALLIPLFDNGLDGTEKTFEQAFAKPSTLNLNKLDSGDIEFVYTWGKVAGMHNKIFEVNILATARELESRGNFVVVICGGAHVLKLVAEQQNKDIGYVLCMDASGTSASVRMAKLLWAMEKFATTK